MFCGIDLLMTHMLPVRTTGKLVKRLDCAEDAYMETGKYYTEESRASHGGIDHSGHRKEEGGTAGQSKGACER